MGTSQLREKNNRVIPFVSVKHSETEAWDGVAETSPGYDKPPKIRHSTRMLTILFTDMVGSAAAKSELGIHKAQTIELEHRRLMLESLRIIQSIYRDYLAQVVRLEGDSYILVFSNSYQAIHFALLAQRMHSEARAGEWHELPQFRVGIHTGEVIVEDGLKGPGRPGGIGDIKGLQADTTARIMGLACGGQILCSYPAFDNARQSLTGVETEGIPDKLLWKRHGFYLLKGREEPIEICEVGEKSFAPMKKPAGNEKSKPVGSFGNLSAWHLKATYLAMSVLFLILSSVYIYMYHFRPPSGLSATEAVVDDVKHKINQLHAVFESRRDYGEAAEQEVREKAPRFAEQLLNLSEQKMDVKHRILKYQFAAFSLAMAAVVGIDDKDKKYYADKVIHAGNKGLGLIEGIKQQAAVGNKKDHELYEWVVSNQREELIRYMLAAAFAIKARIGDDTVVAEVRKHLDAMPSSYKKRYPPDKEKNIKWVMDNKFN